MTRDLLSLGDILGLACRLGCPKRSSVKLLPLLSLLQLAPNILPVSVLPQLFFTTLDALNNAAWPPTPLP